MIKRLLLVPALALSMFVAACSTTQVQTAVTAAENFIAQVQADTAVACKFVPEVSTILALVNSGLGQVVSTVVTAICNSVPAPASAKYKALHYRGAGPAVQVGIGPNNIAITGWRTQ